MYLDKFILPLEKEEYLIDKRIRYNCGYIDNVYPCRIFSINGFEQVDFEKITIFYGGNGSGKSTLLNLIADKLGLIRLAPYNQSELFAEYVSYCKYQTGYDEDDNKLRIPNGSRIITSDDVFEYMLTARNCNQETGEQIEETHDKGWADLKYGETQRFTSMEDYDSLRLQLMARRKSLSRRKFIEQVVGKQVKLDSNGETALKYFEQRMQNDILYCLDEPENSLSPKLQLSLVDAITQYSRYCGCQFIIATHSPFVLSLFGAKIYDLDSNPVTVRKWNELENVKIWFNFFKQNLDLF